MNRKPLVIVGAVLALVALSACNERPGAAAYVGDDRITVEQVQTDSAEVIAAAKAVAQTPLDPAEVNRRQVNRLITERLIDEEAKRRNVTVSDAEVDALLQQAVGNTPRATFDAQLAASQLVPPSQIDDFARTVALNQKLVSVIAPGLDDTAASNAIVKQLGELSKELGTGVAPRFGTWDATALTVGLPPNDLSTPAPVATPTEVTSGSVQTQ